MKQLRKDAGLQQKGLAGELGVVPSVVAALEKRETPPRKRTTARVAKALGVTVTELLQGVPTGYEDGPDLSAGRDLVTKRAEDAGEQMKELPPMSHDPHAASVFYAVMRLPADARSAAADHALAAITRYLAQHPRAREGTTEGG